MKINSVRVSLAAAITYVLGFTMHSLWAMLSPTWFVKIHARFLYVKDPAALVNYIQFNFKDFIINLIGVAVVVFIFVWVFAEIYNMLDTEPEIKA